MRRIVKETLEDGGIQYRVEKNTKLWGLIKTDWHTDFYNEYYPGGDKSTYPAVFSTLKEAKEHCGINTKPKVIKREILYENGKENVRY